jgi:hypothetical protein
MDRQNLSVEVLADRLMEKLDQAIDELNLEVTTRKVKIKDEDGETTTEELEITKSIIDRMGLKQLTSVLKELQTIKGDIAEIGGAGNLNLPATVIGKFGCLAPVISVLDQGIHDQLLVIYGENTATEPHNLGDPSQELGICALVEPHRGGEIADTELLKNIQNEIGHFVGYVMIVLINTRKEDILIVLRVSAANKLTVYPFTALDKEV